MLSILECSNGFFGPLCEEKCHCLNESDICNPITGACESGCANGWMGDNCQKRE